MIDLRSDTVTKPTEKMLEAMFQAKVGDDVYKEDATINLLEERIADMFGMEQALFFPTGTMANQTAIKLHTQPGDQVICDKDAHIYHYEGGGASFNSGVSCKLVHGDKGMFTSGQVIEAINPPDFYHSPLTALVEVENTANRGGGSCWDFEELKKIRAICDQNHLGFHLDGARLWNALIAKNESPKQYGKLFDTISVCLSKGLGCPVGSVLVGKKELMKNAMRIRKILGGGMRQVGYLGAAGLYALDNHIERLKEDHQRAKEIEIALKKLDMVKLVTPVETNIVIFELNQKEDEKTFLNHLQENKIVLSGMGNGKLRIVTHLDYTQEMHERFLEVLSTLES
ncbi:aminotransferase class I/II-fold pyridoxal phosphate-dependent enzyme [Mangrovimonas sp. AS39]|uniref:threonine aldolase family protein n=1 Tax=Mangrovimonas futianensis TaxID=2895523 RepID=UPI001E371920|nr:GntG family PLP-dependent aldolase [Mangrovimonas futianensis]MCF1191621.1 aminotransferase class I/II-fold pyridoxal phosphate-dependent enzyme [Mangrovimonas futianensis]MCF1195491.1 aminotransferase class I/II-fold pyridoxal phosphate-dependent enzyme [Mangrovimonas futianensis]